MSSNINIQVDYDHREFTPGDTISGKVNWANVSGAEVVAFRLFWYTSGKGTQDVMVLEEVEWPISQGSAQFSFVLPNEPYSFSGTLVSLTWAIEAVMLPDETSTARHEFQLTPDGNELILAPVEEPVTESKSKMRFGSKR
jgi:hypothetical protein